MTDEKPCDPWYSYPDFVPVAGALVVCRTLRNSVWSYCVAKFLCDPGKQPGFYAPAMSYKFPMIYPHSWRYIRDAEGETVFCERRQ